MNLAHVEYYFAKFLSAMEVRSRNTTAPIELAAGNQVLLTPNLQFSGTVNIDETTQRFADKVYDRPQLVDLEAPREALRRSMEGRPYQDCDVGLGCVHDVAPFAFRVVDDSASTSLAAEELGVGWEEAVDEQIVQKILPKVKGADLRIGPCLEAILVIADGRLPLTHEKATVDA